MSWFSYISFLIVVLLHLPSFAQDEQWELLDSFQIEADDVWNVDVRGQLLITKRDQITKFDEDGDTAFVQSQKSFGRLEKIDPVNSMRILCFSEEQQMLCFIDNSLTMIEDCIELADHDIFNATKVASSNQSDKVWVLDQLNSTLSLLSLNNLQQDQEIKNLGGLLDVDNVVEMVEVDNRLYILDQQQGVIILDLYGTLIKNIPVANAQSVDALGDYVIVLVENQLLVINRITGLEQYIPLPEENVTSFKIIQNKLFLHVEKNILKYTFLLSK